MSDQDEERVYPFQENLDPAGNIPGALPINIHASTLMIDDDGKNGRFIDQEYKCGSVEDALTTLDNIMSDEDGFEKVTVKMDSGYRIVNGEVLYSDAWL